MARQRNSKRVRAGGVIGALACLLVAACEPAQARVPVARAPVGYSALKFEILRLSEKVAVLELQLQQEQRNAARARQVTQEQRDRIVALEGQAITSGDEMVARPPAANVANTMQAEAELRVAYRAMMRAIERLDISAEEKAALKGSLRPTRSLDRQNPWSVAAFE